MTPAQYNEYQRQADVIDEAKRWEEERKSNSVKCWTIDIDNFNYWEKTLKYWKEEKEIANVGSNYYGLCCVRIGIIEDFFKSIQPIKTASSQTQHNLPKVQNKDSFGEISDEEIEEVADKKYDGIWDCEKFQEGAKWYREQLKEKQCKE